VMDKPIPGSIGGTYVGNPVACAASLAALEVVEEEGLVARADHIGEVLRRGLERIAERFPIVGEVRGLGAMVGAELVRDPGTKEPATEETSRIQKEALMRGLIFPTAGVYGNVIRFLVPLVIPDDALEEGISILEQAFQAALG